MWTSPGTWCSCAPPGLLISPTNTLLLEVLLQTPSPAYTCFNQFLAYLLQPVPAYQLRQTPCLPASTIPTPTCFTQATALLQLVPAYLLQPVPCMRRLAPQHLVLQQGVSQLLIHSYKALRRSTQHEAIESSRVGNEIEKALRLRCVWGDRRAGPSLAAEFAGATCRPI